MGIIDAIKQLDKEESLEERNENTHRIFVEELLRRTGYSLEQIAYLAEVPIDFVEGVKKGMRPTRTR